MLPKVIFFFIKARIFLFLLFIFSACSSPLRVLDYWTSSDFKEYQGMKFLVICNTDNPNNRIEFESQIVNSLGKINIHAAGSHKGFPSLIPIESIEEIYKNRNIIKNSKYTGIIFTSVKNKIESYKAGEQTPEWTLEPDTLALSTTYVLEALILDLDRAVEDELVGVNLVAVTDPESAESLYNAYGKIVMRHFKQTRR